MLKNQQNILFLSDLFTVIFIKNKKNIFTIYIKNFKMIIILKKNIKN